MVRSRGGREDYVLIEPFTRFVEGRRSSRSFSNDSDRTLFCVRRFERTVVHRMVFVTGTVGSVNGRNGPYFYWGFSGRTSVWMFVYAGHVVGSCR